MNEEENTQEEAVEVPVTNEEVNEAPVAVTKESVLEDIEDMLGRMGNAPGVDNVKVLIAELKEQI